MKVVAGRKDVVDLKEEDGYAVLVLNGCVECEVLVEVSIEVLDNG
jgi:hypothetical protein